MNPDVAQLLVRFRKRSGAMSSALDRLQADLGSVVPDDDLEFLLESNGGEGLVGESYVTLWAAEDILRVNEMYGVREAAPGLVLFGSDGGGEGYAFDTRASNVRIVMVPFVGMSPRDAIVIADSSVHYLLCLYEGRQWED